MASKAEGFIEVLGVGDDLVIVALDARRGIARKRPPRSHAARSGAIGARRRRAMTGARRLVRAAVACL
jgi:hypothetical protein